MSVYAYVRVSTGRQDHENQRFEILKFADERKWIIEEWCEETVSGTRRYTDRELGAFLDKLQKGDTLIVTEISRLGRSLMGIMTILNLLLEHEVQVFTCKEQFELGDNINSKILDVHPSSAPLSAQPDFLFSHARIARTRCVDGELTPAPHERHFCGIQHNIPQLSARCGGDVCGAMGVESAVIARRTAPVQSRSDGHKKLLMSGAPCGTFGAWGSSRNHHNPD